MEHALELMPEILGDESVGIKYAINGLLSLTPDGLPILGETPEVRGLWSAAAVWVKEGPGVGRALAEWMVNGEPEIDLQASDVARFYEHQKTAEHVQGRAAEGFNKTYGIVHPGEQWESARHVRLSPVLRTRQELGAVFFEAAGWERPHWYESNARAARGVRATSERPRGRVGRRAGGRRSSTPSTWRMRDRAGDVRPDRFLRLRHRGPGRARVRAEGLDAPDGRASSARSVYTPVLTPNGGFRSDLTVMRLGDEHFRVVTGGAHGMADLKWFRDHLPDDGTAQIFDLTSSWTTLGLWGPRRARHPRVELTRDDMSHEGFPFATCRDIEIGPLRVLASRISYVGDLGWELYVPIEQGARLWDMRLGGRRAARHRAGRHRRLRHDRPAREVLPRLRLRARRRVQRRRGRAWRGGKVKDAGLRRQGGAPAPPRGASRPRCMCTLTVDDHTSASGVKRYMLGGEPILTRDGAPLVDAQGPPLVRHQRGRRAVGRQAPAAVLPAARARGRRAAARGRVHDERYPVTSRSPARRRCSTPRTSASGGGAMPA